jgi:hypothetical protein
VIQARSKRSASILSAIAVIAYAATAAVLYMLVPYLVSGNLRVIVAYPEQFLRPAPILALVIFVALLLLALTGLGAFWIYRFFGERYYGGRGALHWALFGTLLALFVRLPDWILPAGWGWLRYPWLAISPFLAFFLARWLARIPKAARQPGAVGE